MVDAAWVPDRRLSGQTRHLTRGWVARRSRGQGAGRPRAIFAMRKNGRSEVAKLNGATIHVTEQQKDIGGTRWPGTVRRNHFRSSMDVASACFAHPWPTYSTTRLILNGVR